MSEIQIKKINILTQQREWKNQFNTLIRYNFIYSDFKSSPLELQQICKVENIDLVLCFDYEVQSHFSKTYKNEIFKLGIPWLLPSYNASEIENKFTFYEWMHEHNFKQFLPPKKELNDFPYILRLGNGHGGKYIRKISVEQDLQAIHFDPLAQRYICQEYIFGDHELVFHFIAIDGKITKQQTYKHIFTDLVPADSLYIRSRDIYNTEIQSLKLASETQQHIEFIIRKLGFTGCGCIDFKIRDNKLYIFEINSRMGGSLIFYNQQMGNFDAFIEEHIKIIQR